MKPIRIGMTLIAVATLALACSGCGARNKGITDLQRKEAAHLASEAQFAITLRDWSRAEGLLAKAAQVCPDTGEYWVHLGTVRVRQGNRGGAKDAYQGAAKAYADEAEKNKTSPEPWLQHAYVLALLGRAEDARAVLDKAAKQLPQDRTLRSFIEGKQLDRMLADPKFKEVAL